MQIAAVRCGQYTQTIRHALRLSLPLPHLGRRNFEVQVSNGPGNRYGSSGTSASSPHLTKPFLNMDSIRSRKEVASDAVPETHIVAAKGKKPMSPPTPGPNTPENITQKLPAKKPVKERKAAPTVITPQYVFSVNTAEILRHTARDLGYQIVPDGFVRMTDILRHEFYRDYDFKKFLSACYDDPMDAFELSRLPEYVDGIMKESWWVRARRGHNIPGVDSRSHRILNMGRLSRLTYVCHPEQWDSIRQYGISESDDHVIPLFRTLEGQVYSSLRIPNHVDRVCVTVDHEKAALLGVMFFITWDLKLYAVGNRERLIPPETFCDAFKLELRKRDLLHQLGTSAGISRRKG